MPKKPVSRNRNKTSRLRAQLKAKSMKRRDRKAGLLRKRRDDGRLQR